MRNKDYQHIKGFRFERMMRQSKNYRLNSPSVYIQPHSRYITFAYVHARNKWTKYSIDPSYPQSQRWRDEEVDQHQRILEYSWYNRTHAPDCYSLCHRGVQPPLSHLFVSRSSAERINSGRVDNSWEELASVRIATHCLFGRRTAPQERLSKNL